MANVRKFTRGAIGHMCAHFERKQQYNKETKQMEYVKFGNQEIDTARSHLNYNLAPERKSQSEFIKQRCSEVYCHGRKDVNVLCSWVVTAPKDLDPAEHDKFFKSSYQFLEDRYGKDNVVSAYVHKDESGQPHMHFAWVPVAFDVKRQRQTVSAKMVIARKELQEFHPALQKHLEAELGHPVSVLTGDLSDRPDLTLAQYKSYRELCKSLENGQQQASELSETIRQMEGRLELIRAEYEPKKAYLDEFARQQAGSIHEGVREHKGLFGKVKSVEMSPEKWNNHAMAYMDMQATKHMEQTAQQLIRELQSTRTGQYLADLEDDVKQLKKQLYEYQKANQRMSREIERINKAFELNPKLLEDFKKTEKQIARLEHRDHGLSR